MSPTSSFNLKFRSRPVTPMIVPSPLSGNDHTAEQLKLETSTGPSKVTSTGERGRIKLYSQKVKGKEKLKSAEPTTVGVGGATLLPPPTMPVR